MYVEISRKHELCTSHELLPAESLKVGLIVYAWKLWIAPFSQTSALTSCQWVHICNPDVPAANNLIAPC